MREVSQPTNFWQMSMFMNIMIDVFDENFSEFDEFDEFDNWNRKSVEFMLGHSTHYFEPHSIL